MSRAIEVDKCALSLASLLISAKARSTHLGSLNAALIASAAVRCLSYRLPINELSSAARFVGGLDVDIADLARRSGGQLNQLIDKLKLDQMNAVVG